MYNGDRFRSWARKIGTSTYKVVDSVLASKAVEEQSYQTCRSLLKLSDTYSAEKLEMACCKACQLSQKSSYSSVKNILIAMAAMEEKATSNAPADNHNRYGVAYE